MSKFPFKIRVDHRESQSGVVGHLKELTEVDVSFQNLPVGDYCINDLFLFERKTIADLLASIKDGRIFRQACRLAAVPQRTLIILEGGSAAMNQTKMRREAIQGVLIQISVFLGIPLLRAKDAEETARLIVYTVRQSRKLTGHVNYARHFPQKRPKVKQKTQLHILQGIPGIGPNRAAALLDYFDSIEAIFSATTEQLTAVSGINQKTADTIRWAVKEP